MGHKYRYGLVITTLGLQVRARQRPWSPAPSAMGPDRSRPSAASRAPAGRNFGSQARANATRTKNLYFLYCYYDKSYLLRTILIAAIVFVIIDIIVTIMAFSGSGILLGSCYCCCSSSPFRRRRCDVMFVCSYLFL